MFQLLEETSPLKLNFEDLSGITYDVPDLRLLKANHIHSCQFCTLAKRQRLGHFDCVRNKLATNRLATRRQCGFTGQCHLGLTELVQPLIYRGRVLGIFYFGSVVLKATEGAGRRRIKRWAQRRKSDARPLLQAFERVPLIDAAQLHACRERLQLVATLAERVLDAHGLPLERYRTAMIAEPDHKNIPPLVQSAMHYVHRNQSEPLTVSAVAAYLNCHADYLSRVFKQSVRSGLADYILRVRIDRARHLIATEKFSLGEIAWRTGFQDQSHFSRVFKRLVGVPPGQYQGEGPTSPLTEKSNRLREPSRYRIASASR